MIVDTLVQYGDEADVFTVDSTVPYKNLTDGGSNHVLSIGGVFNTFQWKDNIQLLSVGVILPLGFDFFPGNKLVTFEPWPNYIALEWRRASDGVIFPFQPNRYNLFAANYESSIGTFLEPPDDITPDADNPENFQLVAQMPKGGDTETRISMINAPASLDESVFAAPIYIKVGHTLPMI